jgi:hypothetical protein
MHGTNIKLITVCSSNNANVREKYRVWAIYRCLNVESRHVAVTVTIVTTLLYTVKIQSDQKVSVHLIITLVKHAKIFLKISGTYQDNVVRIRDIRWRQCEPSANKCLETGG